MQLDAQIAIKALEKSSGIITFDLEASGLRGDYNSILCASFKEYGASKPFTVCVSKPGDDKKVVAEIRDIMHEYPMWISYYGKGFDVPMIQTRLLVNGLKPLDKHLHLDMYFLLKYRLLTARKSQAHLLRLLGTNEQKMDLSPNVWNEVLSNPKKELATMRARCESDVVGLEALYDKTKHLIVNVSR